MKEDLNNKYLALKKQVSVTLYSNYTLHNEAMHLIEYDGTSFEVIGDEFTEREKEIFKRAIIEERNRIWDISEELVEDEIMKKLLNF